MKLAFSTLGCPEWSWNEIIATAKDMRFDAVEIRGVRNELYGPKIKEFTPNNIDNTNKKLKELGVNIICLTSACYLYEEQNFDKYIEEGKEYIDTAAALNIPFVRVLGDKNPQPGENINDNTVAKALEILGQYASNKSVTVLIETNGVYADTSRLKNLLDGINTENIGVLWDVHHPYRYYSELPEKTLSNIGSYLKYIHLKDSILEDNNKIIYKMMGYGDLPIKEIIKALNSIGYNGYLSLEWVRRWYSDLEAPGVVFLQYLNYMKRLI